MRIVDEDGREVHDPDLNNGHLVEYQLLRDGIEPVDDEKKFAYAEDDWENVLLYIETPEAMKIDREIAALQHKLLETDYISSKLADKLTSCASSEEINTVLADFNESYAEIISQRQEWRDEINELERRLQNAESPTSE